MINILLLNALLLMNLIVAYPIYRNRLTSITLWITGMFLIASLAYIININYFGNDISITTTIIVEASVFFYFIGEIIGTKILIKPLFHKELYSEEYDEPIRPKRRLIVFLFLAGMIFAIYRIYTMYRFAMTRGHASLSSLVSFIRPYIIDGQYTNENWVSLVTTMFEAISYISLFYFIYNLIKFRIKDHALLLPVLSYVLILFSTTGRTGYMKLFIIALAIIYIMLKSRKNGDSTIESKFIKYGIRIVIALVFVFYMYGYLFRNSQRTITEYFANYFSAGLYGLDTYLRNPWPRNTLFGEYTLSNYYYYINKLFHTNYIIPSHNLPFFSWVNSQSNIYTGLLLSIQDYGVIGMLLTRSFIAMIYSSVERGAICDSHPQNHVLRSIMFGYLLYVAFSIPIADRFVEFLTVTTFPSLVIFIIIFNRAFARNTISV